MIARPRRTSLLVVAFGLLAALTAGCSSDPLTDPTQLTIYSIDGRDFARDEDRPKTVEMFHGYPVLGKLVVTDPADRRAIMAAIKAGVDESDGVQAKCFWPRHGIRAEQGGQTRELVICFECFQVQDMTDQGRVRAITRTPQAVFNKQLRAANVPIAPVTPGMTPDD